MKLKFNKKIFRNIIPLVVIGTLASCNLNLPTTGTNIAGPVVDTSKPVKVALFVPTESGNPGLDEVGKSLLNGARLAESRLNKSEIELMVYATGGNPARAAQLAVQAQNDGANLIIGPLKSEEVLDIESKTTLPILTFSNNTSVADTNIFTLGTNFENIANRVIAFQKNQGSKKLGVVYPNDLAGRLGAAASLNAANSAKVKIVAQETYNLDQQSIQQRSPQIAQSLKSSGADMVIFTDNPAGGLSYIASGLRDSGYTSADARYLGLARWDDNTAALSNAGINGLFAIPDPARTAQYGQLYQQTYGSAPHQLSGLAYDGVAMAIQLVREARSSNDNTPFGTDDIRSVKFLGANGAVKFNGNNITRALAVQKLIGGTVTTVSTAQ